MTALADGQYTRSSRAQMVDEGKSPGPGATLESGAIASTARAGAELDAVPERVDSIGIETRRQKAALETALFGSPTQEPTVHIAHYEVIGRLGAGGMGVVYVVHDRKLDRRVALKLLRYQDVGGVARQRLQREAMAMARLSHPNVVTVHEVGMHEGQVFIAMEFVSGSHLRAWLAAKPRSWREIVAIFIQAGQGLAAAHAAGIIHRDFKPDNVLVGDDGRVRVADFGLAHGRSEVLEPSESSVRSVYESGSLEDPLTEPGVLLGTPAYMAPEQHNGLRVDERSDQFSFCVALWEALYGERPFKGKTLPELVKNVLDQRIEDPPQIDDVPPWLRAVLRRGLSLNPYDRWSSIEALIHALGRDPERVRARRIRAALLVSVVLAVIGLLGQRASAARRQSVRAGYWNSLTEVLLEIERERGLRQANEDARRAQDAARLSAYRSYRPKQGVIDHEDPTAAAALLREVEGEARFGETWIYAANELLGQPLAYAVLDAHRGLVMGLAFSPDGRTLYSGGGEGAVRRWVVGRDAGQTVIQHERGVVSIALSGDGRYLASGARDGVVKLWDASAPERPAWVVAEHGDEVTMLAFSPDAELLASASKDATIRLSAVAGGEPRVLRGHRGPVHAIDFDAAGERLLSASSDTELGLWELATGRRVAQLRGHAAEVYHARFIDRHRALSGSDDATLRVWALEGEPVELQRIEVDGPVSTLDLLGETVASGTTAHTVRVTHLDEPEQAPAQISAQGEVWSLALLPGERGVVFGAFDGSAQRWSPGAAAPSEVFLGHGEALSRVAIDRSGRWLATASYDGQLRVWDLERPDLSLPVRGPKGQVFELLLADEGQLLGASHDGTVRVWSSEDGRELQRFDIVDDQALWSLALSPDGERFAVGTQFGAVVLVELASGARRELLGHGAGVLALGFSPDGERLASASLDGTTRVWSTREQEAAPRVLSEAQGFASVLDFGAWPGALVTAADSGIVRVWDGVSGEPRAALVGHEGPVWAMAHDPDSGLLATGSEDGSVRVWSREQDEAVQVLRGHEQAVRALAFGREGARLLVASGSADGDARVWDARSGELLRTLRGHREAVLDVLFLADGRVATASEDNTIRVWAQGQPSLSLPGHADAVLLLRADPSGGLLYSTSGDLSLRIWRLEALDTRVERLEQRLREASTWCLSVERRMRELNQDEAGARAAQRACEARMRAGQRD